jgi:hypothetical protein
LSRIGGLVIHKMFETQSAYLALVRFLGKRGKITYLDCCLSICARRYH